MVAPGKQLVAACIACTLIAWIFVLLRCVVRVKIVRSFGWDDWLMNISLIFDTLFSAFNIASVHFGAGRHLSDLRTEDVSQALKMQVASSTLFVLAALFIKLSIGMLLLRIASSRVYRCILWGSMVIMSLWGIATFLILVLQCRPLSLAWDPTWTPTSGNGQCMNRVTFTNLVYAFSATDIFFDWVFALIPVPMLWGIQMSSQVKISLMIVLGLGVFASATTLVRLRYLVSLIDVHDLIYSTTRLLWSVIGLNLGIAAACMATLRPLFRDWKLPGFSSGHSRPRLQRTGTGDAGHYGLSDIRHEGTTQSSAAVYTHRMSDDHTSQESIIEHEGIHKRVDVEVTHEG